MSWLETEKRLLEINKNYPREAMRTINFHYIYVNQNDYIEKVETEKMILTVMNKQNTSETDLENKRSFISKEKVLDIIHKKNRVFNKKYILKETMIYNIDLEPENIFLYSKTTENDVFPTNFSKVLTNGEKIVIQPSIFIFHEINGLYFLFYEDIEREPILPKSILKNTNNNDGISREPIKKRVTIKLKNRNSKTRKSI